MRTRPLILAGALLLATAGGTLTLNGVPESQAAGDPTAGRQLTQNVCADCHRTPDVNGGGDGPSLDRLSRQRSFSPDTLADVMATDPHDGELRLSRAELANISAYLNVAGTPGARIDRQTTDGNDAANGSPARGRRADERLTAPAERDETEAYGRPSEDDDDGMRQSARQQPMPLEDVIRALSRQGYRDIREVEREGGGRYEVYARDTDGRRVELKVDATTGKVLDREDD